MVGEARHLGRVKWFSDHLAYGFITCIDDSELQGIDVFVHFKALTCDTFKTLSRGEYVSFSAKEATPGKGIVAQDVTGISGGPLLCQVGELISSNAMCNLRGEVVL